MTTPKTCTHEPSRYVELTGFCFACWEEDRQARYAELQRMLEQEFADGRTITEWMGSHCTDWSLTMPSPCFIRSCMRPDYLADHLTNRHQFLGTVLSSSINPFLRKPSPAPKPSPSEHPYNPSTVGEVRGPWTCGWGNNAKGGIQYQVRGQEGWIPFIGPTREQKRVLNDAIAFANKLTGGAHVREIYPRD